MRTLRLGRTFDAVFTHDAIVYMTTEDDLRAAIETAFVHTRPGGCALFVPDFTTETFVSGEDYGGSDGPDGRGMRYLEWVHEPGPDGTYVVDYAYLLREADGTVRVVQDQHREGLHSRDTWTRLLTAAGFTVETPELDPEEHEEQVAFLCRRP
jgi:hypothetical protein